MRKVLSVFAFLAIFFVPVASSAQHIVYSDPDKEDSRRTNFDIIGKICGNILVFQNNRSENAISVYGLDMKMHQRVNLDFMPEKNTDVYFIPYQDYCYMFYEYQKKNIVHLVAVKIDGTGKRMEEPTDLDTTHFNS